VLITIGFQWSINWPENRNCALHLCNGELRRLISSCRKHMCFLWCRELIKRRCSTQHFSSSPCSCLITVIFILKVHIFFCWKSRGKSTDFLYTVRAEIPSLQTPKPLLSSLYCSETEHCTYSGCYFINYSYYLKKYTQQIYK
jgi:hypothetical protein